MSWKLLLLGFFSCYLPNQTKNSTLSRLFFDLYLAFKGDLLPIVTLKKGFEHNKQKIIFVSNWKISLDNLRIKLYDQSYHQKVEKKWKTPNFLLNGQNTIF